MTIGYGDQKGYDRTPQPIRDVAHRHDQMLRSEGALTGIAGTPVQVRNPEGRSVETTEGPYMRSVLPIAGFAIIDAGSMEEAVAWVSKSPCAVAHGVVEVWPLVVPGGD